MKNLKKLIKQQTERLKWRATNELNYAQKNLASALEQLQNAEDKAREGVEKLAEALNLLRKAGFKPKVDDYYLKLYVHTTQDRLKEVYKAIGKLDPRTIDKDLLDGAKGLVKVSLYSEKFPMVKVLFKRKLGPKDPCKVVTIDVPAKKEFRLVCNS